MKRRNFLKNSLVASSTLHLPARTTAERPTKGIRLKDGEGRNQETIMLGPTPLHFKVLGTDTGGELSVFVSSNNRRGDGPPLHVHQQIDEFFCVLEGEFLFQTGAEKKRLKPGDTLFVARKIPHGFDCVSEQPGKLLVAIQPVANMENFFRELGRLLPKQGSPDPATMQQVYQKYDSTIVGPPVTE